MSNSAISAKAPSMAVSPCFRAGGVRSSISGFLSRLDSHCHDDVAAAFERDARQRTRWRGLQHVSVPDREIAYVPGALEPVFVAGVINGAREVRAFLALGEGSIFLVS